MIIEKLWLDRLEKSKYKNLDNFLKEFSSDDYNYTREMLLEDIHFYIDELLGYNDIEESETMADDENYCDMLGW
jgi:hypothetical protein